MLKIFFVWRLRSVISDSKSRSMLSPKSDIPSKLRWLTRGGVSS